MSQSTRFPTNFPVSIGSRIRSRPDVAPWDEPLTSNVPRLEWAAFKDHFSETFRQGEHVTLIGATGRGKTTVAVNAILPVRRYVVVMAAKPQDPLIAQLEERGYYIIRNWPPPEPREHFPKVVLWPPVEKMRYADIQRQVFAGAMAEIYESGCWCVYWPEARYMSEYLRLKPFAEVFWQQGRTLKISFIVDTQRPRWIPLSAYDQATHLFIWKDNDESNVERVSQMAGMDKRNVWRAIMSLDKHDFLYINTREGELLVSKAKLTERDRRVAV